MADEILSRKDSIRAGITPTGRKLEVMADPQTSLFWIAFADKKGGNVPAQLSGAYTGRTRAQNALDEFLTEFWDMSDSASKKAKVTNNVSHADSR